MNDTDRLAIFEMTNCPVCDGEGLLVYGCRHGFHPADPRSTADEGNCWACNGCGIVDIYDAEDLVKNA